MTLEKIEFILILLLTLTLFIWNRWRHDVIAMIALLAAFILGFIPSNELFSGFSHPATITIAFVLILSAGLMNTGAVEGLLKVISPLMKYPFLHTGVILILVAFLSMFMNNVGALALMMPVAIHSTLLAKRSPASILMPLSFASILGGLVTLIGTPPNIIIATYRQQQFGEPFSMFDFSYIGGSVALAGIVFISILGWKLVKVRKSSSGIELFEIEGYIFETKLSSETSLKGKTILELEEQLSELKLDLVLFVRKKVKYTNPPKKQELAENDLLVLEGAPKDIDKFVSKFKLKLLSADDAKEEIFHSKDTRATELVVSPNSRFEGRTIGQLGFSSMGVNVLALSRQGKPYRERLKNLRLKTGDILLLHGEQSNIDTLISFSNCYPLAQRKLNFGKRKFALLSLVTFGLAIITSTFGWLPLTVSFGLAVVAFTVLNLVPLRELYDHVDWSIIVLIGAMMPLGQAFNDIGLSKDLADQFIYLAGDLSPIMLLAAILIFTMTLSDILNNAATVVLMAPIASKVAQGIGASPDPFLMAVAIGASCAFLTPIGHQNNALVLGPGGYHFGDYWRLGLPLEIIILIIAIPLLPVIWPL